MVIHIWKYANGTQGLLNEIGTVDLEIVERTYTCPVWNSEMGMETIGVRVVNTAQWMGHEWVIRDYPSKSAIYLSGDAPCPPELIKPCPFCDGTVSVHTADSLKYVQCNKCMASSAKHSEVDIVIKWWNKRV